MMKIFKFIFSILLFSCLTVGAQNDTAGIGGLKLGFDLSRLALPYIQGGRVEYDGSMALNIKNIFYPVIEVSWGNFEAEEKNFSYSSTGYSLRAGVDKNYLKKENVGDLGIFFAGFRYGISFFKHEAPDLEVNDPYWGDFKGSVPVKSLNAHWLEMTTGIRARIFRNIYLGWSLRGRLLIKKPHDSNMSPVYIPGFGKVNGRTNLDFRYSIFYRIPF